MMKQNEAVRSFVVQGQSNGLTGESLKDFAVENVKIGLLDGTIGYGKDRTDEKEVKKYAGALVSNWLKKDITLNGGIKYVPETKRGPQVKDEQLITLNNSLKSLRVHSPENMELIGRVETAIQARKAQLTAEKGASKVQSMDETIASLEALGLA